jgi:hypothetical protein
MVERSSVIAAHKAEVVQQVHHRGVLFTANCGMGLIPDAQGVTPPTNLGFELNHNQEEDLGELSQHTDSVYNH